MVGIGLGERRTDPREICPVPLLSATNTTWIDLGSNQGLRDEKPATNRLSHDTVRQYVEIRANVKDSVRTSQRTQSVLIMEANLRKLLIKRELRSAATHAAILCTFGFKIH